MKRLVKLMFLASSFALLVAACGGGQAATATPPPTSTRPAAAPTPTVSSSPAPTATRAAQPTIAPTAPPTAAPTPTPRPAATATPSGPTPKYGGTITGFLNADPINWDLVSEALGKNLTSQRQLYNGLIQYCPAGAGAAYEVCPELAKSWTFSQDGSKLVLQLYPGVKWHDGAAFSSADAVFTLNRMLDPKQASPASGALLRPYVQSVEAPDASTVVLNLKASSLSLTPTLASAWFVVQAKHVWDRDKAFTEANVMGTGPYKYKRHQKGASFEFERNPSYFHPEWPYLDGIKFLVIPDSSTQAAAFKIGRVQVPEYFAGWTVTQWKDMKATLGDKITGELAPTLSTAAFLMNHTIKPFDDPKVRRAMRITIDMQEIITKLYDGAGLAGVVLDPDAFGEFALPYADIKNLPGVRAPTADDIAEAKRLLAEAGYPNGFKVKIQYTTAVNTDVQTQFALVSAQYQKIGVTFEAAGEDARTIYANMAKGNYYFAAFLGRGIFTPDPQSVFTTYFTQNATLNYAHYVDPVVDQLYNEQFKTLDQKKRVQLVRDLQRQVLKFEGATSPMRWERGVKGFYADIKDLRFGLTPYDGWTFERVWVDKK